MADIPQKAAIWIVCPHADYSGIEAWEEQGEARERACALADKLRHQVAVYACVLDSVACQAKATLTEVPHG